MNSSPSVFEAMYDGINKMQIADVAVNAVDFEKIAMARMISAK